MLLTIVAVLALGLSIVLAARSYLRRQDVLHGSYIEHDAQYDR